MNERIRELHRQVMLWADTPDCSDTVEWDKIPEEYTKKLTELIVRECAKFCDEVIKEAEIAMEQCEMVKTSDRLMMLHDGTRNGAQMAKHRFKKHFGVE